jgi:hypothetical protein
MIHLVLLIVYHQKFWAQCSGVGYILMMWEFLYVPEKISAPYGTISPCFLDAIIMYIVYYGT